MQGRRIVDFLADQRHFGETVPQADMTEQLGAVHNAPTAPTSGRV